MGDNVLTELKQIKNLLAEIVGTFDMPPDQKFSREAIEKAAKEFRDLQIKRGEWIAADEISKVIKHANWRSWKIIIEKFEFKNFFVRGKTHYFNKKDLMDLNNELKERNINLTTYEELLSDQDKFQKYLDSIKLPKAKSFKHFKIPEGLKDVYTRPYSQATEDHVKKEIEILWDDFKKFDLSEYIELYEKKTYAYFRYEYSTERYVKPEIKKYCKDWCFKYNYAQNALKRIAELKKEKH